MVANATVNSAQQYLTAMRAVLDRIDVHAIERYAQLLYDAWRDDRAVYVFGNGGSASCASHHVADYVKTAQVDGRRRLRAFSLCDNREMLTAIGNDLCYDDIFAHALASYARPGDVAVAISCSGNSGNILRAAEWAREHQLTLVALTGCRGGTLAQLAHLHLNVPDHNYGLVEDVQLSIGHIAAQLLQHYVRNTEPDPVRQSLQTQP